MKLIYSSALFYSIVLCCLPFWSFAQSTPDYCLSKGNKNSIWINNLKVGAWNYQSGNNNGYLSSIQLDWPLQIGYNYALQLDMGGVARIQDTLYWQIWLDSNGDKDFLDQGEHLFKAKTLQRVPAKGQLLIPANLLSGAYHLRLMLSKKAFASACGEGAEVQEVEDYQFNIKGLEPCPPLDTQNIQIKLLGDSTAQFILHNPDSTLYLLELYDDAQNLLKTYIFPRKDTILLPKLNAGITYGVRVQLQCPPYSFSDWSPLVKFSTPVATCITPESVHFYAKSVGVHKYQFITDLSARDNIWRIRLQGDTIWRDELSWANDTLEILLPYDNLTIEYQLATVCKNLALSEWSTIKTFKKSTCSLPFGPYIIAQYNLFYPRLELIGGAPAELYNWRLRAVGDSIWKEFTTSQLELHIDTVLEKNHEFQLQILCNDGILSDWSPIKPVDKLEPFCTMPGPQQFYSRSLGGSRYQFIATIPAQSYLWRYRVKGDTVWADSIDLDRDTLDLLLPYDDLTLEFQLAVRCEGQIRSRWSYPKEFQSNVLSCLPIAEEYIKAEFDLFSEQLDLWGPSVLNAVNYQWRLRAQGDSIWRKIFNSTSAILSVDTSFETAHEVQVRIECDNGKFSAWSNSKIIPEKECPRAKPNATRHFDYFHGGIPAVHIIWISKIFELNAPATYRWSYREAGLQSWSSPVRTIQSNVVLEGMIPGKTYEIRMEIICGKDSLNPQSVIELKEMPNSCVEINATDVTLRPFSNMIEMDIQFPTAVPYQVRIRQQDSIQYDTLLGLGQWMKQFINLNPGTTYEISLRGYCYDGTELPWSDPLFVRTLSCNLPRFGRIEMDQFNPPDSIGFTANFIYSLSLDTSAFSYHWQYRVRDSSNWTRTASNKAHFPHFIVQNVQPNTNYEIQLVTHCINNPVDSFVLSTYFSTDSMQCGSKPDTSVVNFTNPHWPNTFKWVTLKLPDPYLWSVRVLERKGNEWTISSTRVYQRIPPNYQVYVAEDQAFQFRIICPNNTVGPWSEIIFPGAFAKPQEPISLFKGFVLKEKLVVAPNPSNGQFNILLPADIPTDQPEGWLEVFNVAGQKVLNRKTSVIAGDALNLDLSDQSPGMYLLRLKIGQQVFTERLLLRTNR